MKSKYLVPLLMGFLYLDQIDTAQADVIIHGTRVVYPSAARETTLQVSNQGTEPSLVQLWIDEGDSKSMPEDSKAPFVIMPPLSRINPDRSQSFRILALPIASQLSQTQETLYWLNVLEIPAKPNLALNEVESRNYLQIAVRSRIKVFYRPNLIKKQINTASEKLQWYRNNKSQVMVKNPTPFYITIKSIDQKRNNQDVNLYSKGMMLAPYSEQTLILNAPRYDNLFYVTLNDYGAEVKNDIQF